MKRQPNRLPADAPHNFGGAAIDRSKPLLFRLNGIRYEAFEGDTVLSALLAAGVDTVGTWHGEPIALDERFSPPVVVAGTRNQPAAHMPMDRVPVIEGLTLATVAPRQGAITTPLMRLLSPRTLGHRLDEPRALEGAWPGAEPSTTVEADTIVVGGGIAGMNAALVAAEAGDRVLLIERRPNLGGDARFFGTVGEEETPDAAIARLTDRIGKTPSISVYLCADAFALAGTRVRVHQVSVTEGRLEPRVVGFHAPRVVLATGAAERLPIFPGNRAPGLTGAVAAFHRADRHGVWIGQRALVATPHNYTYRLALLASDAGIEVQRIADSRLAPQSRFIDFCKASGITHATGLALQSAHEGKGPDTLKVGFAVAVEGAEGEVAPMATSQLIAAGGWQPRLALWLMAGGACAYEPDHRRLEPRDRLEGVALAGSALGLKGLPACLRSGEAAVLTLLGKAAPVVEDVEVDAAYESHEAPTSVAGWRVGSRGGAFLDGGLSFSTRPQPRKDTGQPAAQLHTLSIGDVAAGAQIGLFPPGEAGIVARERCLGGGDIVDSGWRLPAEPPRTSDVPPFLHGRFGPKPQLIVIAADDGRRFEPGCLIYPSSDAANPFAAVGAVIGPAADGEGSLALAARTAASGDAPLFARDVGGVVAVKRGEKAKAG